MREMIALQSEMIAAPHKETTVGQTGMIAHKIGMTGHKLGTIGRLRNKADILAALEKSSGRSRNSAIQNLNNCNLRGRSSRMGVSRTRIQTGSRRNPPLTPTKSRKPVVVREGDGRVEDKI